MEPVLKKEESIYYVDECDIMEFISINHPMDWNECCEFVIKHSITNDTGRVYWEKKDLIELPQYYNDEQLKWIGAFFDAHPWIEKMMVVFDD